MYVGFIRLFSISPQELVACVEQEDGILDRLFGWKNVDLYMTDK